MKSLGYYNGTYGPLEDMTVPMNDRVCYFGDGVYEAAPCSNHRIFLLEDHLDRLYRSASMVDMVIPMEKGELGKLLGDLSREVEEPDQFVYWQITRGTADRVHSFPKDTPANVWITIRPAKPVDYGKPRQLITMEDTRFLHCNIKTLNLLPNVMASQRAEEAGCYEAVFHREGRVTECSHSNLSILRGGTLVTAPTDHLILPGISRAHLLRVCKEEGVPVREEPFRLEELMDADEVLVTSSTVLCLLADRIDGKPVGGRATELARRLQDRMREDFHRETRKGIAV